MGKTRLLREFLKGKNGVYLIADASEGILDVFSRAISREHPFIRFDSWDDLFEWLESISKEERFIFILDEFQYIYQTDKSFPTVLQRWWERLKKTRVMIILSGSIISTIYRIAMGYGSALYGRKTAEIELGRLDPFDSYGFFHGMEFEEFIGIYGIVGGVPRYLEELSGEFKKDLIEKVLNKNSYLHNEPMNLLFEEFKDHGRYFSIMNAIANGSTRFNEISQKSRVISSSLTKYLNVLERVSLIEKEQSILGTPKGGLYRVKDNLFNFWFRYIYPNRSMIEMGMVEEVAEEVIQSYNTYLGKTFEEISRYFLVGLNRRGGLNWKYQKIGRWWHRGEEVDIVCIDKRERHAFLIEVKWKELMPGQVDSILKDLKRKLEFMPLGRYNVEYGVICKRSRGKKKENIFDLSDMESYLETR